jgi:hypothetical protein
LAANAADGAIAMQGHGVIHELGRQCRHSVEVTIGRTVFDRNVTTFDIAGFLEPLPEGAQPSIILLGAGQQAD